MEGRFWSLATTLLRRSSIVQTQIVTSHIHSSRVHANGLFNDKPKTICLCENFDMADVFAECVAFERANHGSEVYKITNLTDEASCAIHGSILRLG